MKAVGYHVPGGIDRAESLLDVEVPAPVPGRRDLLVRVKAVSVNPVDVKVRAAASAAGDEPKVLGWDAAGIVEAVGDEVSLFAVGDEVFYAGDITRAGSNAELQVVDERIVGRKPKSLNWGEAAALPLTAITAWELLFDRLRVPRGGGDGQSLLVVNGAGGVGSILIQLARRLTNLTVIATASRPETTGWVRSLGAHHVVDHRKPLEIELTRLGIPQVNYVASLTASDTYLPVYPNIILPQGHLALIDDPDAFDITEFKRKSISVSWEFMFTRAMFETPDMIAQHHLLGEVARLVDEGVLRTTMTNSLSPIDAATLKQAHKVVESGTAIGKIVLVASQG